MALFFSADLPVEELRGRLATVGFEDLERALRNFQAIREGQAFAHSLQQAGHSLARLAAGLVAALGDVPDPDLALTTFERLIRIVAPRTTFLTMLADTQDLLALLIRLFGTSEFLSATLLRQPELLDALLTLEPAARCGREGVTAELRRAVSAAASGSARLDALRRVTKAAELRIGLLDILDQVDVTETHRALTHLAEACLETALQMAGEDLVGRFGMADPPGFAIVGLGKLGGLELGYASDLDLVYVYNQDGTTTGPERVSHVEYYSRLADRVSKVLTSITQEGSAYRVDARLRPGGQKGELALPLAAFEKHFARLADLWERQAYIKARPVAGDPALSAAFVKSMQRFVYESDEPADLAERIQAMRHRMEVERVSKGKKGAHVKLGSGGIVDIEFLVQYSQLRYGRTRSSLRTVSTLDALRALAAEGLLGSGDARILEESYRFLRRVENRLRIVADLSLNTLPAAPAKMEKLAKRMGYRPSGAYSARDQFLQDYGAHTGRVRGIYNQVFGITENLGARSREAD